MRSADAPFHHLALLPRTLWLPALVASVGTAEARLLDTHRWAQALLAGDLPPTDAVFGDTEATLPLRAVVGELGLPGLSHRAPALAEQVLRTLLWHLDRIADHQPRLDRAGASRRWSPISAAPGRSRRRAGRSTSCCCRGWVT